MPYTHTTLATARATLATRLNDPNLVQWAAAELNLYIQEALRFWQALTGFYRDRVTLATANNTAFYDLTTAIAQAGVFDYNVTDANLVNLIEYHLLEPATIPWSGTDQFTLAQVTQALQGARDQFLVDTGCVVTRTANVAVPGPPVSRVPLADTVMDVRRAAFIDQAGVVSNLFRDNELSGRAWQSAWATSPTNPPQAFSVSLTPPVALQLIPAQATPGEIDLISVSSGPALNPAGPVKMSVPDDFAWAVKFGALADLLSNDGQNTDAARAQYCEQRYQQGVKLAMLNPSVMYPQIGDVVLDVGSVFDMDVWRPGWQNSTGTPDYLGMAGRNLIGLSKVPNGVFSVSLDLIRNMVVPVADGDFLQVGRETLDVITDYAQHLAMFKEGGAEFEQTFALVENIIRLAATQNARLKAADLLEAPLKLPAQLQELEMPRKEGAAVNA